MTRAEECSRVWVWHTRTERASTPRLEHINSTDWRGTNILILYNKLHAK